MSIFKETTSTLKKTEEEIIIKYEENRDTEIIKRYKEDCYKNEKMIIPFTKLFAEIIGEDSYHEFMIKTGLSQSMFYDLQHWVSKKRPCSRPTIISVCVGYNVGLQIAQELLRSQGSYFNPHNEIDSAYILLLTEYRGKSIDECNKILDKLKISKSFQLGVHARKPKQVKKKTK